MPRPSLSTYMTYRLGRTPRQQLARLAIAPFTAPSLTAFWRIWNPVAGYVLA